MRKLLITLLLCFTATVAFAGGSTAPVVPNTYAPAVITSGPQAQEWTTSATLSPYAFTAQTPPPAFAAIAPSSIGPNDVVVQPGITFQPIDGVGGAWTDASGYVAHNYMTKSQHDAMLADLFSKAGCNWSFVRIGMGGTTFQSSGNMYSYDDVVSGNTDTGMLNFNVNGDLPYLIPDLQYIHGVNGRVKILASPWGFPTWMLSSGTFGTVGGVFNATGANQTALANYFVDFVTDYANYGLPIWAVTPLNEPGESSSFAQLTAAQETTFIGNYLGPQLFAAYPYVKIIGTDDNWQNSYPSTIEANAAAQAYCSGIAWHGYSGGPFKPSSNSYFKIVYPNLDQYATEWRNVTSESSALQMSSIVGYMLGSFNAGARGVMYWVTALDQNQAPNNGYTARVPVVTVNNSTGAVSYSVAYYVFKQLSHFLQPGAVRCASNTAVNGLQYVAYLHQPTTIYNMSVINPDGSIVLVLYNGYATSQTFQVIDGRSGQGFPVTMAAGDCSTFTWGTAPLQNPSTAAVTAAAPSAPTLTATGGSGQVNLSWTAGTSTGTVAWYNILRSTSTGTETAISMAPAGTTAYTDLIGTSGGPYYYKMTETSSPGGVSALSAEQSASASAAAVPSAPVVTATATASIVLTWPAVTYNGSVPSTYNILRSTTSGSETAYGTAVQGSSSYTDPSTIHATTYYYKVNAVNATGTSANSTEVSAVGP